jgi:two-component system sensor kinase FixL
MRALRLHAPDLDPAEAAFAALDLAVGAFEGSPSRLVWRTDAFARLMPKVSPGDLAPPMLGAALQAAGRGETAHRCRWKAARRCWRSARAGAPMADSI